MAGGKRAFEAGAGDLGGALVAGVATARGWTPTFTLLDDDIAALFLQSFLDSNPTDQDLLDIEARYGTTVFRQLRTIPKWSDDTKLDKQTRANVETTGAHIA